VKLPNFLSVETRPFDAETYEDEIDEEETLDEEGRARYGQVGSQMVARLSALRAGCPLPPGRYLVLISVRG
jgi:hypothetical protein